jgi:hypothetical protein
MGFFHWNIYFLRFDISIDLFLKFPVKRYLAINRNIGGTIVQPAVKRTSSFIGWPENVRRVNKILWSFLKHCYMLLNFVLFCRSSWQSVTISNTHDTTEHENKSSYFFVLACMLNFVGQHHASWICYTSINNNGYFYGIYVLCKHTISLTNFTSFPVCRWNVKFLHI